jgi:hypothetical protein
MEEKTYLKSFGVEFEEYSFFLKRLTKKWAAAFEYVKLDMILDFQSFFSSHYLVLVMNWD